MSYQPAREGRYRRRSLGLWSDCAGRAAQSLPLPINKDPKYFDLGACGPERRDLKGQSEYCGIFRTPSLRNVATRKLFFHNGIYHSLDEAVRFYVQRDTNPEKFYPVVHGKVQKFDDLPKRYWANVNTNLRLIASPAKSLLWTRRKSRTWSRF